MSDIKLSNGRNISFHVINVNSVELKTDAVLLNYTGDKLILDAIHTISIGDTIKVSTDKGEIDFKVNQIKRTSQGKYILIESPSNISTMFLTPVLGLEKEQYLFDTYLVNAYYDVSPNYKRVPGCMYLLYKFSNSDTFLQFETAIKKHHLFVGIEDPSPKHVLVIMKIPEVYIDDIKHVMKGEYSLTSKPYQRRVIKFYKHDHATSPLPDIFDKSEKRRKHLSDKLGFEIPIESELYDKPNLQNEVLWNLDI